MLNYKIIEIFTSEDVHWNHKPLSTAVIEAVQKLKTSARCIISRGTAGVYENGEIASTRFEVLSYRMPLKIEIIIPESELPALLPGLETMVTDGIIAVRDAGVVSHKTEKHLIPRHLSVKDVMTREPKTITPDTRAGEIIRLLLSSDINGVPVVNNDRIPVGMVTQTDLVKKVGIPVRLGLIDQFGGDKVDELLESLDSKKAAEIMTAPPVTVKEDDLLSQAVDLMLKKKLKRLPVVSRENRITGILSIYDVFQTVSNRSPDIRDFHKRIVIMNVRLAADAMITDNPVVAPETPIEEVIRIIDASPLQRVVVVDADGKFAGMIFDHDLLALFSEHKESIWQHLLTNLRITDVGKTYKQISEIARKKTASEIMRTDLVSVFDDEPIEVAVRKIAENQIRYVPVIDRSGKFRGLVSRRSLLLASSGQ